MNFEERLALECMMNKSMFAKYQAVKKKNEKTEYQIKKQEHRQDILKIVERLFDDNDDNDDDDTKKQTDDNITTHENVMILHPKVIHSFDHFVQNCIENIEDFQRPEIEEECAPFFTDECDENSDMSNDTDE